MASTLLKYNANVVGNILISIFILLVILSNKYSNAAPEEQRLIKDLFAHYDPSVRPVYNGSHSVLITFGVTLVQVMDMDERNQVLVTNVWLEHVIFPPPYSLTFISFNFFLNS